MEMWLRTPRARTTRQRTFAGLLAVLLAGALTACGHDRQDVEKAFRAYHAALLARDFPTACSYNTPEATSRLLSSLQTQGINAISCEDAFAAIYAEEGGSAAADGVGSSVQIKNVTLDGDQATVSWTAVLGGESRPATSTMRYVDGQWRFVAG